MPDYDKPSRFVQWDIGETYQGLLIGRPIIRDWYGEWRVIGWQDTTVHTGLRSTDVTSIEASLTPAKSVSPPDTPT